MATANQMVSLNTFTLENKEFYEKTLLSRLLDELYLYNYAKKATLPKKNGNQVSWRIFKPLLTTNTNVILTEGVSPNFATLQIVEFKSTLKQLGRAVELTDLIDLEGIDPVVTETSELLGEDAAQVIEDMIMAKLVTSKNVYYANASANADVVAGSNNASNIVTISVADLNGIIRVFKRYNVKPYANGKYIMVIDPEVEMDLKNLTSTNASWVDIAKYADGEAVLKGEIGSFCGFKFVVSNRVQQGNGVTATYTTKNAVRDCIAFGADGYGVVELEGGGAKPEIIHQGLGSAGTSDPLKQRQTLGWKINGFETRILHDEGVCVYKVGTKAGAVSPIVDTTRSDYNANNNI